MFTGLYLPEINAAALRAALADWQAAFPQAGVLALVPEAEQAQVGLLQSVARDLAVPLMGGIFPAVVAGGGFQSRGLVLLRLDTCPPWMLVDQLDGEGERREINALADFVRARLGPETGADAPTLFLLFDGLLPHIGTLLTQLHARLGSAVRYAGANAGSESFQPMPCLFDHTRLVQGGCIALLAPADTQCVVEHGYPVTRALFRAISTTGNQIVSINDQPAMTVYRDLLRAEFGVELNPENFYQYAVHYPFGVVLALDVMVRIPVGVGEAGAIHCVGQIPPNSVLKLLQAPTPASSLCVPSIARRLTRTEGTLLTFYCAGRRLHFGDEAALELVALREATLAPTLLGAVSLGEIGTDPDMGIPAFHNAALVCMR